MKGSFKGSFREFSPGSFSTFGQGSGFWKLGLRFVRIYGLGLRFDLIVSP